MARRLTMLVVVVLCLSSKAASAQQDYSPDNHRWNGLQTLRALAKGLGYEVHNPIHLDWRATNSNDIVFLVYPTGHIPPHQLLGFVHAGGRVVLADDFGNSENILAQLGIVRERFQPGTALHHDNLHFAPIATPLQKNHPLASEANVLVTNHPMVFRQTAPSHSVFGFGSDQTLVATHALGKGKLILVSDPSIFINRMLQFDGNLQFTINLLRYLGKQHPGSFFLLSGSFSTTSHTAAVETSRSGLAARIAAQLNLLFLSFSEFIPLKSTTRVGAVLIAIVLCILAITLLPFPRKQHREWTRFLTQETTTDRLDRKTNWYSPATKLAAILQTKINRLLGSQPDFSLANQHRIRNALHPYLDNATQATLARIYPQLVWLQNAMNNPSAAGLFISRRQFNRLYDAVFQLMASLSPKQPTSERMSNPNQTD